MLKSVVLMLTVLMTLPFQVGCLYAVRYDGPYKGKVVDDETRMPIQGAIVLGTWGVYHFGLAGGYSTFYDAKETITNENGEFLIVGQGVRVLSSVGPMRSLIYKAGYTYVDTSWSYIIKNKKSGSSNSVKWEEDVPIFLIAYSAHVAHLFRACRPPTKARERWMA